MTDEQKFAELSLNFQRQLDDFHRVESQEQKERSRRQEAGEEFSPLLTPPTLPGTIFDGEVFSVRGVEGGPYYLNPHIRADDPAFLRLAYLSLDRRNLALFLETVFSVSIYTTKGEANGLDYLLKTEKGATNPKTENAFAGVFMPRLVGKDQFPFFQDESLGVIDVWRIYQRTAISTLWVFGRGVGADPPLGYSATLADTVASLFWATVKPRVNLRVYPRRTEAAPFEPINLAVLRSALRFAGETRYGNRSLWEYEPRLPISTGVIAKGLFETIGESGQRLRPCPNCGRIFYLHDLRQMTCSAICRKALSRKKRQVISGKTAQEKQPQREDSDIA